MPPTSPERITAANWREIAYQRHITLVSLAARTGVSFSTVYAYSRGVRRVPDAWLEKAAEILGEGSAA